jgi:hypothetical protein
MGHPIYYHCTKSAIFIFLIMLLVAYLINGINNSNCRNDNTGSAHSIKLECLLKNRALVFIFSFPNVLIMINW